MLNSPEPARAPWLLWITFALVVYLALADWQRARHLARELAATAAACQGASSAVFDLEQRAAPEIENAPAKTAGSPPASSAHDKAR